MKRFLVIALLTSTFFLGACKKSEIGLISFDVSNKASFQLPPNSILDLPPIITPPINGNWQSSFGNNNADVNKIQNLKLKSITLNITSPAGKGWGYMENIDMYISADGLAETEIAFIHGIPVTQGPSLDLNPVDVDLQAYAKKDNFSLRIASKARQTNSDYINVDANMVFKVTANVLK